MPRITVADGPSNAGARPGEVGHMPPAEIEGEHGPEPVDMPPGDVVLPEGWTQAQAPEPADYGSLPKAALVDEAKSRELPVSGSKADLAARLAEHDAAQLPADALAVLAQGGD